MVDGSVEQPSVSRLLVVGGLVEDLLVDRLSVLPVFGGLSVVRGFVIGLSVIIFPSLFWIALEPSTVQHLYTDFRIQLEDIFKEARNLGLSKASQDNDIPFKQLWNLLTVFHLIIFKVLIKSYPFRISQQLFNSANIRSIFKESSPTSTVELSCKNS